MQQYRSLLYAKDAHSIIKVVKHVNIIRRHGFVIISNGFFLFFVFTSDMPIILFEKPQR